jgi:hypothetical protein
MDRATPLLDFAGRRTTIRSGEESVFCSTALLRRGFISADFAKQMQAQFAPTLMFHGPGGALLAESIVGYRLADFYGAYLERAIEESRDLLQRRK